MAQANKCCIYANIIPYLYNIVSLEAEEYMYRETHPTQGLGNRRGVLQNLLMYLSRFVAH